MRVPEIPPGTTSLFHTLRLCQWQLCAQAPATRFPRPSEIAVTPSRPAPRLLFRCNPGLGILKDRRERSAPAVRERIRPVLTIVRDETPDRHGLHRMREDAGRAVVYAGRDAEQNHAVLCAEFCRLLFHDLPRGKSLLVPLGLVFGGRLGDPRARRGDRSSGFARARKQPQAVIVDGVSLEAAPPARQDDADTTSIIVNGRKGLYGHGHRGGPAVPVSNARSAPQHGASDSYSAARLGQASAKHFQQCAEFPLLRNRGLRPLAVTVLPIALAR